ncbi:MAG TPA: hypothetical protein VFI70_01740 [Nitrososphaeraceae archaeon]|nr:hypothetical protein [Nitrososphaeraceae archaeon]
MKKNSSNATVSVIMLLLIISSLLLVALSNNDLIIILAVAKKKSSTTTSSHHITTKSNKSTGGFAEGQPIGREPPTPLAASNNSATGSSGIPFPPKSIIVATTQRMTSASVNATVPLHTCLPALDRFIKPLKEKRFIVVKQCVTITGTVVWTHYFNDDGDANFNVALDAPYKNMLAPGNYDIKYVPHNKPAIAALHIETVCQAPVTSNSSENVGACNGYDGPDFRSVLPKIGQHVMVTGRYLVEFPEVVGGLAELHPVYAIKIIH